MEKYYINKDNWERLYSILKTISGIWVRKEFMTYRFMEGVYFIMRTGAQWREIPSCYGKWRTIRKRHEFWCRKRIWDQVLQVLSKDYDGESLIIDATIARAHPCSAGYRKGQQAEQAPGRSKGGFTTRIHAVADALGQGLKFCLTPGQGHDITQAGYLIEGFEACNIIADKGYDAKAFIEQIEKQGCTDVIPARSNRKNPGNHDPHLYRERHLVECFFNTIKHFQRVFSQFDKRASSFIGFLAYASVILWLR